MVEPSTPPHTTPFRGADDEAFDLFEMAHRATDPFWHALTGMCGGCGSATCHAGRCVGNSNGHCTTCPTRRDTGEVRG